MNKKQMIINVSASIVSFIVQLFVSFWLSPYVVGKLGEEAYGFLNLANNFVLYASLVAIAINSMACRFISIEYNKGKIEESKKYFVSVFVINWILYSIILIASLLFINKLELFLNISANIVVQVKLTFILTFINLGCTLIGTVYTAAAFTTNKMYLNSIVQIVANIFKSILIVILFFCLPPKIYFLSIATLIAGIITLFGNYCLTKKLLKEYSIKISMFETKKVIILAKSGTWMLISNISNILLNGMDLLLTNQFVSGVIMGRLSLAKLLPMSISSFLGYFANIFTSSLTRNFSQNGEKNLAVEVVAQLRILSFFLSVPFAGIIVYGYDFLKLWLMGKNYNSEELWNIYILMIITLVDVIVSTYMYSIHSVLIALDKVKGYAIVMLFASIISISGTLFFLNFTSLGVFAIVGISVVVLGITHGVIVPAIAAKCLNEKIYIFWLSELKSWSVLCILCLIFYIISFFMYINSWITFLIEIVICVFVGYFLSFLLVLNEKERKQIIKKIRK